MKKVMFALLVIVTLVSCGKSKDDIAYEKSITRIIASNGIEYKVIKIGDCEYIGGCGKSPDGFVTPFILTHKGDCSNPIHKSK